MNTISTQANAHKIDLTLARALPQMRILFGAIATRLTARRIAGEHLSGHSALRKTLPVMLCCLVIIAGLQRLLLA